MQTQILESVEAVWQHHCAALQDALTQTVRELNGVVRLDEYQRHGHEEASLQAALGPFASSSLNTASLSSVLGAGKPSRAMSAGRLERVIGLLETLDAMKDACGQSQSTCTWIDIEEDEDVIRERAEDHLNRMAKVFRALRMAQLEIRSKYDASVHDAVFAEFDWSQLSPAELRLCPPFLVVARIEGNHGKLLRKAMALLESRQPIKVAALRTSLRKNYAPTTDPSIPATMAVEMLPLAMRGVYFVQTCVADPAFEKNIIAALNSPRPGILSLLCPAPDEDARTYHRRAEHAVRSRAFPLCLYDPDRARNFVNCLDLSGNPTPEDVWAAPASAVETVDHANNESAPLYTFAHFAAEEAQFDQEFTVPDEASRTHFTPLTNYLELNRRQRVGRIPIIRLRDEAGSLVERAVSGTIVTQTADRMHLWRTLQEIAGVNNPQIQSTRTTLQSEFGAEQKALLVKLQDEMEQSSKHREKAAVAEAVRKLVAHLTGVDGSLIDLSGMLKKAE